MKYSRYKLKASEPVPSIKFTKITFYKNNSNFQEYYVPIKTLKYGFEFWERDPENKLKVEQWPKLRQFLSYLQEWDSSWDKKHPAWAQLLKEIKL